jgi:hypothetical protein
MPLLPFTPHSFLSRPVSPGPSSGQRASFRLDDPRPHQPEERPTVRVRSAVNGGPRHARPSTSALGPRLRQERFLLWIGAGTGYGRGIAPVLGPPALTRCTPFSVSGPTPAASMVTS